MNIAFDTARELYDLGFTYRHYAEHPQKGMVYFYENAEWVIGGNVDDPLDEYDYFVILNGIWLPSEMHLLEWLSDNDFVYAIVNTDGFVDATCKDSLTQTQYQSKTPTLDVALAAIIKKILKKHEREFDTKEKRYGVIENG